MLFLSLHLYLYKLHDLHKYPSHKNKQINPLLFQALKLFNLFISSPTPSLPPFSLFLLGENNITFCASCHLKSKANKILIVKRLLLNAVPVKVVLTEIDDVGWLALSKHSFVTLQTAKLAL